MSESAFSGNDKDVAKTHGEAYVAARHWLKVVCADSCILADDEVSIKVLLDTFSSSLKDRNESYRDHIRRTDVTMVASGTILVWASQMVAGASFYRCVCVAISMFLSVLVIVLGAWCRRSINRPDVGDYRQLRQIKEVRPSLTATQLLLNQYYLADIHWEHILKKLAWQLNLAMFLFVLAVVLLVAAAWV